MSELYRLLPSVDLILQRVSESGRYARLPRPLLKDLVNMHLDQLRADIRGQKLNTSEDMHWSALVGPLHAFLDRASRPHFRRVINATGVVVHTNLGRSLLAHRAVEAVTEACAHYSNLEFSLDTGQRGSRYAHVEELLCKLTGAEAGLVVNNNAAAVLLMLDTLAKGKEVVVSRGQLVEIGGSFRIPDVMAKSGAVLREVGATNRTHLHDYERAITSETAALLKVHTSNFRIIGFHKEVGLREMVALGEKHGLPILEDLGSGNLFDFTPYGLDHEPTVQEAVADGAAVVTFSGDKVLGGPQAGIIVGRKEYIDPIKKNPMNRALRIDKMTLAALEATLRLYLDPELARTEIPTLRMITASAEDLRRQANKLARGLRRALNGGLRGSGGGASAEITLFPGASRVGGGAYPERDLPTTLVAVRPQSTDIGVEALRDALLDADPPLVGRIEHDAFCLDPRTLADAEHTLAAKVLAKVLAP
ncbi:L-seryl-tRNA(Sec) selenium transferase [Desulfonatronum sp. SC1]|uniref:L-seryl-tRNA(Sec) selenium transferase n=1 Tax=Desulfonatronum sp. SC1 TaxID=2109626 RepID=UPI000D30E99C|nr:L-seryl-tRNA(Sec) selenium transferase [Desulfonatronum sp. SC1]PTN31606.1 L-seryl-tRNA(Sec) selenium transferase [Desulfonatronum sp. SC1]